MAAKWLQPTLPGSLSFLSPRRVVKSGGKRYKTRSRTGSEPPFSISLIAGRSKRMKRRAS